MASSNLLVRIANRISSVQQIITGLTPGTVLAIFASQAGIAAGLLGSLFVGALKAAAPILVSALVLAVIAQCWKGNEIYIKPIIVLYLIGTFSTALVIVTVSFALLTILIFSKVSDMSATPLGDIIEVPKTLPMNLVSNPISALADVSYIGTLAWALILGSVVRNHGPDTTHQVVTDMVETMSTVVKWVIRLVSPGIFELVSSTIAETGLGTLKGYTHLLAVLLGSMTFTALVVNPLIVWWEIRRSPYPLVFTCPHGSGVYVFFARSSAANIPVNITLAKKLGPHEDTYSVAIPLEATINMMRAAVTTTILAMTATHTQYIQVDLFAALLLSLVTMVSACGASDAASGSLLLVPLAYSLFGIPNGVATQMVAVGFIIGVTQNSAETVLNSSTDVLFTAAADLEYER